MSALAHHIEAAGVPTAVLSLVREHTEAIKPPRTLWVPFPLGRPFGPPRETAFQQDVLRALLRVFSEPCGPVIIDYPHDAPGTSADDELWACPLPLPPPGQDESSLESQVLEELGLLDPWYEVARRETGGTAVGLSGLDIETAARLLTSVAQGVFPSEAPPGARAELPPLVRFAADDLKAFAIEAALAQPAAGTPTPESLHDWLFEQTSLGEALHRAREVLAATEDRAWRALSRQLVPAARIRR